MFCRVLETSGSGYAAARPRKAGSKVEGFIVRHGAVFRRCLGSSTRTNERQDNSRPYRLVKAIATHWERCDEAEQFNPWGWGGKRWNMMHPTEGCYLLPAYSGAHGTRAKSRPAGPLRPGSSGRFSQSSRPCAGTVEGMQPGSLAFQSSAWKMCSGDGSR